MILGSSGSLRLPSRTELYTNIRDTTGRAAGLYRISSGGRLLTESGYAAVLADADGSASQLRRVAGCEGGWSITSASGLALDLRSRGTWEGNEVWLYGANGTAAQAWELADAAK